MEVGRSRRFRFELFAADEPRAVPKTDQKQELARKALEQAFEGKENLFAKLDDDGNGGGGNGNDDRGGGGGGGGGGNDEGWGEVFSLAVKILMYVFLGVVFLVVWPKFFTGASNVYNRLANKGDAQQEKASAPAKEDFDDDDFEALVNAGSLDGADAKQAEEGGRGEEKKKKVKRAFPEREAFDTWQFGAKKGMDAQDELAEMQLQMETVSEEMMSDGKFHDEFNSKPRSKHLVLKDEKGLDKPGPYQDYVTAKWK